MPQARNTSLKKQRAATKPQRISSLRAATPTTSKALAALVDENKELTGKQKLFVQCIAEGDSIPNAIVRAGYSNEQPSYGYRLVAMPNIKKALAQYQAEYRAAAHLKKQDVLDMLKKAYDDAQLQSEPATMVSAAREIGKLCGFYEPTKVTVSVHETAKFAQLSDQELFALIEQTTLLVQDEPELLEHGG